MLHRRPRHSSLRRLHRVMLAAGLLTKLRKRRRCLNPKSGTPNGEASSAGRSSAATDGHSGDDMDVSNGIPFDAAFDVSDGSEDEQTRGKARAPLRTRKPQQRPSKMEVEDAASACVGIRPRKIVLLKSVFEGRPPVILFTYTAACGAKQRPMDRAVESGEDSPRMFYSHTDAVHQYNAVINILRQGGLYRVRADSNRWTVLWSLHPTPEQLGHFSSTQRANHFPGSFHLGRKDHLWRNIARLQRRFGKEYNIAPQGYILPKGFVAFESARVRQPDALWIWKPCSQSCGRGIKVFSSDMSKEDLRECSQKRGIIQRYIPSPLLIGGRKFDMRIYVAVLSYDPLKIYINDEGLVRFATEPYSESVETLSSRMMHLTNYSVNKQSPAFVQNSDSRDDQEDAAVDENGVPKASKWSLTELRTHFAREGLNFNTMLDGIKDLVIKTLIAVDDPLQAEWCKTLGEDPAKGWTARGQGCANRKSCFELYGFDVLVDSSLKAWLLEVNISPSLSSGSPLDKRIKTKLVADIMTLVGVQPPASLWSLTPDCMKWPENQNASDTIEDLEYGEGCTLSLQEMEKKANKLAACSSSVEAVAAFDETAWQLIIDSHEEDMRCGGLERIFPSPHSGRYSNYFVKESYCNMVLRRWHEAGGGDLFRGSAQKLLPHWVPRQICFSKT